MSLNTEAGSEMEIYRDLDVDDGSITERDERILTQYTVRWDFDIETDLDENGDPADDWLTPIAGLCRNHQHVGQHWIL